MRHFDKRMVVYMPRGIYQFKVNSYPGIGSVIIELPAIEVDLARIDNLDGNEDARRSLVTIARRKLQIQWINYADIKKMKRVDASQ